MTEDTIRKLQEFTEVAAGIADNARLGRNIEPIVAGLIISAAIMDAADRIIAAMEKTNT